MASGGDAATNALVRNANRGQCSSARYVLVTADALHCQKDHAKYLVEQRGSHYLLTVKGNQPTLRKQLAGLPWAEVPKPYADQMHLGRAIRRSNARFDVLYDRYAAIFISASTKRVQLISASAAPRAKSVS